jgi:hypothetical protein
VALHTADSLRYLFAAVQLTVCSLNNELHVAYAGCSPLASRFLDAAVDFQVNQ